VALIALRYVAAGLLWIAIPAIALADNGGDHVDGWGDAAAAAAAAAGAGAMAAAGGAASRGLRSPPPNIVLPEQPLSRPPDIVLPEQELGPPKLEFEMGEPTFGPPDWQSGGGQDEDLEDMEIQR
jgi:hypothetical protein